MQIHPLRVGFTANVQINQPECKKKQCNKSEPERWGTWCLPCIVEPAGKWRRVVETYGNTIITKGITLVIKTNPPDCNFVNCLPSFTCQPHIPICSSWVVTKLGRLTSMFRFCFGKRNSTGITKTSPWWDRKFCCLSFNSLTVEKFIHGDDTKKFYEKHTRYVAVIREWSGTALRVYSHRIRAKTQSSKIKRQRVRPID